MSKIIKFDENFIWVTINEKEFIKYPISAYSGENPKLNESVKIYKAQNNNDVIKPIINNKKNNKVIVIDSDCDLDVFAKTINDNELKLTSGYIWFFSICLVLATIFQWLIFGIISTILALVAIFNPKRKIILNYQEDSYDKRYIDIMKVLYDCPSISLLTRYSKLDFVNKREFRYDEISRKNIYVSSTTLDCFETNVPIYEMELEKDKVYFLPDRILIKKSLTLEADSYSQFKNIEMFEIIIQEALKKGDEFEFVGDTWEYVRKNGEKDCRYKSNNQLYKYKYGMIRIRIGEDEKYICIIVSDTKCLDRINEILGININTVGVAE